MAITLPVPRPTDTLEWASVDQNEPISGLPNKTEPTDELKLSGLLDNENLTRQHYNYLLDLISDWTNYFDSVHGLTSVYLSTDLAKSAATLSAELGGTWVDTGTIATAGTGATTLRTYSRTA